MPRNKTVNPTGAGSRVAAQLLTSLCIRLSTVKQAAPRVSCYWPKPTAFNARWWRSLSITKVMALVNQFNAPCAALLAQCCAVIGSISLFAAMRFQCAARALAQNCAGHWVAVRGLWCRISGQLVAGRGSLGRVYRAQYRINRAGALGYRVINLGKSTT